MKDTNFQSFKENVKMQSDIIQVASRYMKVLKDGSKMYKALCPFHQEKTPSFKINPARQSWFCFGQCKQGGDVFELVMRLEGVEFKEALKSLARQAGIPFPERFHQSGVRQSKDELEEIRKSLEFFAKRYQEIFEHHPSAAKAREYMTSRGLNMEACKRFGCGWAPIQDTTFSQAISKYSEQSLIKAGLARKTYRGLSPYFFGRVLFPLKDLQGRVLGFGGRVLDHGQPKYLNSPESPVFQKGQFLYGLDRAQNMIRKEKKAVVVEGYMDVLAMQESGFSIAVAPMGTSMTQSQISLLTRLADEIVLMFDGDAAGQSASERAFQIASERDVRVKILALNKGEDPADRLLSFSSQEEKDIVLRTMKEEIDTAPSALEFYYQKHFFSSSDKPSDQSTRLLKAKEFLKKMKNISLSPAEHTFYLSKVSREIGVDENLLMSEIQNSVAKTGKNLRRREQGVSLLLPPLEKQALHLFVYASGESLIKAFQYVKDEDFQDLSARELFEGLRKQMKIKEEGGSSKTFLYESLSQNARRLLSALETRPIGTEENFLDITQPILALLRRRLKNKTKTSISLSSISELMNQIKELEKESHRISS